MSQPTESQAPENATPFVDTPLLQAKRRAFDHPTQANLDALIEAARGSDPVPASAPIPAEEEERA